MVEAVTLRLGMEIRGVLAKRLGPAGPGGMRLPASRSPWRCDCPAAGPPLHDHTNHA